MLGLLGTQNFSEIYLTYHSPSARQYPGSWGTQCILVVGQAQGVCWIQCLGDVVQPMQSLGSFQEDGLGS